MIPLNDRQALGKSRISDYIKREDHEHKFFLLNGKAGTGKTQVIAELIQSMPGYSFLITAVTHKAKVVLRERIGNTSNNVGSKTIAALLRRVKNMWTGKYEEAFHEEALTYDVIIVEEASMIDEKTYDRLMELKGNRPMICIADIGQIRPIREDQPFSVVNALSPVFLYPSESFELFERMRQTEDSPILEDMDFYWNNSQEKFPLAIEMAPRISKENSTGFIHYVKGLQVTVDKYLPEFKAALLKKDMTKLKVITYKVETKDKINRYIRNRVMDFPTEEYIPGDLIMLQDNYRGNIDLVENSKEAFITSATKAVHKSGKYILDFWYLNCNSMDAGKFPLRVIARGSKAQWEYRKLELEDEYKEVYKDKTLSKNAKRVLYTNIIKELNMFAYIDYSYCISAHKSQGSTYENVIINYDEMMESIQYLHVQPAYCLIYTAGTRAKRGVTMCLR